MRVILAFLIALFFTGCLQTAKVGQPSTDQWQKNDDQTTLQNKQQISQNAIVVFTPQCANGDAGACNDLGANYEFLKEYDKAFENYKKSCDKGVELGCSNLGLLYEQGLGTKKDPKLAIEIYKTSCNNGGMQSCYHLGNAYRKGEIVAQDYYLAMRAYTNACESGDIPSCANIGAMYELGLGVNKDEMRAYKIYKVACFRGLNKACPQMKRLGVKLGQISEN